MSKKTTIIAVSGAIVAILVYLSFSSKKASTDDKASLKKDYDNLIKKIDEAKK